MDANPTESETCGSVKNLFCHRLNLVRGGETNNQLGIHLPDWGQLRIQFREYNQGMRMSLVLVIQRTSGLGAESRPLILNAMNFKYHGIFYYWRNHNSVDIATGTRKYALITFLMRVRSLY